jgi:hypothetical protein
MHDAHDVHDVHDVHPFLDARACILCFDVTAGVDHSCGCSSLYNMHCTLQMSWASDHTEHQPVAFPGSLCCLGLLQMSAGGLEEYTQLCMKWGKLVPLYLGSDWRTQLQELLSLPPGECPGCQSTPLPAKGHDGVRMWRSGLLFHLCAGRSITGH